MTHFNDYLNRGDKLSPQDTEERWAERATAYEEFQARNRQLSFQAILDVVVDNLFMRYTDLVITVTKSGDITGHCRIWDKYADALKSPDYRAIEYVQENPSEVAMESNGDVFHFPKVSLVSINYTRVLLANALTQFWLDRIPEPK